MAEVTQVAAYEREYATVTNGPGTATLANAFTPAPGETIVVWWTSGIHLALPTGAPAASGGVTWTEKVARAVTSTTPLYCWVGKAPAVPGEVNPAVPFNYTGASGTSVYLVVQRFAGVDFDEIGSGAAGPLSTTGTGGARATFTQEHGDSVISWMASDYAGLAGTPTPEDGDTLVAGMLASPKIAAWVHRRTSPTAGTGRTYGFSGFSSSGARKLMFARLELPPAPDAPAVPLSSRQANFNDGTIPGSVFGDVYGAEVVNGRLRVPARTTDGVTTNYAGAQTTKLGDGADTFDRFLFQATDLTAPDGASYAPSMAWVYSSSQPQSTRLGWEYDSDLNVLKAMASVNWVDAAAVSLPYDPVAMAWWSIRNTGTQIVWETSPTGAPGSWTTRRTLATPAWANTPTCLFAFEAYRTTGPSDYFEVDNVNIAGTAPTTIGATAVSGTRATALGRRAEPIPAGPPAGADALQARTLTELRLWENWLATNNASGFVGEFGSVSVWARFGDAPQQQQWTDLLGVYLAEADRAGVHTAVWASGRNWVPTYTLGLHTAATTAGGALAYRSPLVNEVAGHPSRGGVLHGVSLSGWEEGVANGNAGAGTVRSGPSYPPSGTDWTYLAVDVDFARLPVPWEKLQPTLGGDLDAGALTTLHGMIAGARAAGISLMVELHNYGRYTTAGGQLLTLGSAGLTQAHLVDLWTKLSAWLRADPARSAGVVALGLMNEPHDLPGGVATWENASQAVVTALRNAGESRLLSVAGYGWSSLTDWSIHHPDGWITDPGQSFVYEAHHYWDTQTAPSMGPRSGQFQQAKPGGGVETLTYATELAAAEAQTAGAATAVSGTRATGPLRLDAPAATGAVSGSRARAASQMAVEAAPSGALSGTRAVLAGSVFSPQTVEAVSGTEARLAPSVMVNEPARVLSGTLAQTDPILSTGLFGAAVSGTAAILGEPGIIPASAGEVISGTVATVQEQRDTTVDALGAVSGTVVLVDAVRETGIAGEAVSGTLVQAAPFYTQPGAGAAVSASRALAAQPNLEMAAVAVALSGVRAEFAASWASGQAGAAARSGSVVTAAPRLTARAAAAVVSASRALGGLPSLEMGVAGRAVSGSRVETGGTVGYSVAPLAVVSGTRAAALAVTVKIGAAALVSGTLVRGSITLGYTGPGLVACSGSLALGTAATPITPVFVRPRGVPARRSPAERSQLLVCETVSGRVITSLPFSALSWTAPLNKQATVTSTLVLEESLDHLADQRRYRNPRAALHALLVGEWRFSLVAAYGRQALAGGPLQPSEDLAGGRVGVGAVGMERMLERRILHNHSGSGKLTDASRDIWINQTNPSYALYRLVQEAVKQYGRPSRKLPLTCSTIPDAWGLRSYNWPAYDLKNVWTAMTDLAADVDGPDFRLDPVLYETDDGPYVYWDLQIGDPTLPASGNIGPNGPTPWTFAPARDEITRTLDAAEMANRVFATGGGQDRNKTVQLATDNGPAMLGWPDLEIVDSVTNADSSSAEVAIDDSDAVSRQASSLVAALSGPTNKVKIKMPADGWPSIAMVHRGDLARIDTRNSIYLDPGFELRRITQIDGGSDGTATLSCELDDDLLGV